jgi:hypothetical protein
MAFTYSKLAEVTLASSASTIDFTNIPQNYNDLVIRLSARNSSTQNLIEIRFNSSSTGYTRRSVYGNGSSAASSSGSDSQNLVQSISTDTASTFGNTEIYIPNYAGSTNKSISMDTVQENNATGATALLGTVLWSNVTAITNVSIIQISGSFVQHSTATLYGVKAEV